MVAREIEQTKGKEHQKEKKGTVANSPKVKSPSDTTIYVPALRKLQETPPGQVRRNIWQENSTLALESEQIINNLIEGIRITTPNTNQRVKADDQPSTSGAEVNKPEIRDQLRERAAKHIAEAEQFRASVNAPKGNITTIMQNPFYEGNVWDDDEFFHITCHVDPVLIPKIQRGEFVDLEKLTPRLKNKFSMENQHKTELCIQDGNTFFTPYIDKERKITNFQKWENAFRVYATIYCQANPERSHEIWQYVYIINTASSVYSWLNVAEYDFAFRHMIGSNPKRNWGKTYTQMWNLCMTDPVTRNSNSNNFANRFQTMNAQGRSSNYVGNPKTNTGSVKEGNQLATKAKTNYCWKFNKGKCKFGANCKFINRCSYCDASTHGLNACPQKKEADTGKTT